MSLSFFTPLSPRRPEQLSCLTVGSWIFVRNSRVDMFSSHMRLCVDRWGLIESVPAELVPDEVVDSSAENNLSLTEYELVGVEESHA